MSLQHPNAFTTFQRFTDLSSETVPENILASRTNSQFAFQADSFYWNQRDTGTYEFWQVDEYYYKHSGILRSSISDDRQTLTMTSLDERGNDVRFLVHNEMAIAQLYKSNIKQVWDMLSALESNLASDEEIDEEIDELFRLMKTYQRNNIIAQFPDILSNEVSHGYLNSNESSANLLFTISNAYNHILFRDTDSWDDFTNLRFSNGNTFHTPRQLERFHEEVIRRLRLAEVTDHLELSDEWLVNNFVWSIPEGRSNGVLLYPSLTPQVEVALIAEENDVCFADVTYWNFFGMDKNPRFEWYVDNELQAETSERFSFAGGGGLVRCVVKADDCLGNERTASAEHYKIA